MSKGLLVLMFGFSFFAHAQSKSKSSVEFLIETAHDDIEYNQLVDKNPQDKAEITPLFDFEDVQTVCRYKLERMLVRLARNIGHAVEESSLKKHDVGIVSNGGTYYFATNPQDQSSQSDWDIYEAKLKFNGRTCLFATKMTIPLEKPFAYRSGSYKALVSMPQHRLSDGRLAPLCPNTVQLAVEQYKDCFK